MTWTLATRHLFFSTFRPQKSSRGCYRAPSPSAIEPPFTEAEFVAFQKVEAQLGCPDCADGGAEYLELSHKGHKHRVTFEFGKAIPGFETLLAAARKERDAFNKCGLEK
jgi:hypothetical protein